MKEIEKKLADLQRRHSELTQCYDALQLDNFLAKREVETLRSKCKELFCGPGNYSPGV